MSNYSFEKGKHGAPSGMIFPYFREINGLLPLDQDYKDFIPAGYLRCRGQILQADQFPQLAEILGVGSSSIYKKEGITLQERNDSGTGGTLQLPDLGSKYITTSSNPGQYLNDTTTDLSTNQEISRAGIAVVITGTGESVEFGYDGDFLAPRVTLSFSGSWRNVSPPSRTQATTLTISNFIAHGHLGTHTIARRINQNNQAFKANSGKWAGGCGFWGFTCRQPNGGTACPTGSINPGIEHRFLSLTDAGEDTAHPHTITPPGLTTSGPFGAIPQVTMSANVITTTVNVRTSSVYKMDDIAPKFILCEYLIKF